MTPSEAMAAVEQFGGIRAAARKTGTPYTTMQNKFRRGKNAAANRRPPKSALLPVDKLLDMREREFEQKAEAAISERWAPINVTDPLPVAVLWFGDPHIDDDGCNVKLLRRHCELCANTPGLYGANIGDTTNNWAGRLARLYAEQNTSRPVARRLARWLLVESGVEWLLWLMGNHDEWESGGEILRGMNERGIVMDDWEARVQFEFPSGDPIRIHAAHDFKGHSQWNIGHGPSKVARMESDADLFVCGHKHDWTIQQFEIAGRHRVPTIIRARGYKFFDTYAKVHGFQSAQSGAGILTIFNPTAADPAGRILAFSDVEAGVEVLKALRLSAASQNRPRRGRRARSRRQ